MTSAAQDPWRDGPSSPDGRAAQDGSTRVDSVIDGTTDDRIFESDDGTFVYASSHTAKRSARLRRGTPAPEPVVITKAEPSYYEQLRSRRRRYLLMMSCRVPCLIGAALLYQTPWLALLVLAISIPLPWCAVLIANDRAPRKPVRPVRATAVNHERALPSTRRELTDGR
jgi:hypothetical protein